MRSSSVKQGFMEPTGHGLYYENRYPSSRKTEQNDLEAQKYDLCENSSDDSTEELQVEHAAQKPSRHTSSYGSTKRPKYRPASYKIAPNRNAKHSIAIAQKEAGVTQETYGTLEDEARTMTTNVFTQENVQQRNLSSFEQFESTRRKRLETRVRRQAACQKARKIRQRAMEDAAAAQKCLVESVPEMTSSPCVLAKRSEDPILVDFTEVSSGTSDRRRKASPRNLLSLRENWKGEEMDLKPGGAYVVIS